MIGCSEAKVVQAGMIIVFAAVYPVMMIAMTLVLQKKSSQGDEVPVLPETFQMMYPE